MILHPPQHSKIADKCFVTIYKCVYNMRQCWIDQVDLGVGFKEKNDKRCERESASEYYR